MGERDNERLPRAERVYRHLKQRLLDGAYPPGGRIPVEEIATELEVSRQPVMEAMKRLSVEGFVSIVPQVGCRTRRYEGQEIHDFFHLFATSEAFLSGLAAQRATPEDIVKLRIINGQIGTLSQSGLSPAEKSLRYRALNRELHLEIRKMARSAVVGEFIEGLRDLSDFFIAGEHGRTFQERLDSAHAEHEALIDAIDRGDSETARKVTVEHILAFDLSVLKRG